MPKRPFVLLGMLLTSGAALVLILPRDSSPTDGGRHSLPVPAGRLTPSVDMDSPALTSPESSTAADSTRDVPIVGDAGGAEALRLAFPSSSELQSLLPVEPGKTALPGPMHAEYDINDELVSWSGIYSSNGRKTGTWTRWEDGRPVEMYTYDEGVPVAPFARWYPSGQLEQYAGSFRDGLLHGTTYLWHPDGSPRAQLGYEQNRLSGNCAWWGPDGQLDPRSGFYEAGERVR